LRIAVDLTAHRPVYEQIIERVERAVASGELKSGDQLPTVRQLAGELRVNFNTVARAYRMLDAQGIISTQHGRGTFILGAGTARKRRQLRRKQLDALMEEFLEGAARLGFSSKQLSERVTQKLKTAEKERTKK
jgi:GntR family transcriptional regulator